MARDGVEEAGGRRSERGLTLLEVVISIGVISILFLVVVRSTLTVADSNTSMESFNAILTRTQAAMADLHEDISTARRTFEEDAVGRAYFNAIQFGPLHPRAATCLLTLK